MLVDSIDAQAGSSVTWDSGILEFTGNHQTLDANFLLGETITVGTNQILSGSFTADDTNDSIEVNGGHVHLRSASGFGEGKLVLTSGTLEFDTGGNLDPNIGTGQVLGQTLTLNAGQRLLTGPSVDLQVKNGGSLTLNGGELQTFTSNLVEAGGAFTCLLYTSPSPRDS